MDVPPPPIKINIQTDFLNKSLYAISDTSTREAAEITNVANEGTVQDW